MEGLGRPRDATQEKIEYLLLLTLAKPDYWMLAAMEGISPLDCQAQVSWDTRQRAEREWEWTHLEACQLEADAIWSDFYEGSKELELGNLAVAIGINEAVYQAFPLPAKPFVLSEADREWLGEIGEKGMVSCHNWAFLQLREERARPYFGKNLPLALAADPSAFLKGWGYTEVKQPQEGDLVVYMGEPGDYAEYGGATPGSLKHTGVMAVDGKVRSKWGGLGFVVTHELERVPKAYGNRVQIFRRTCEKEDH